MGPQVLCLRKAGAVWPMSFSTENNVKNDSLIFMSQNNNMLWLKIYFDVLGNSTVFFLFPLRIKLQFLDGLVPQADEDC